MRVRTASGGPPATVRVRLLLPTVRAASDGPPYRALRFGRFVMACPASTGSWSVGWTRTGEARGDPENNEPGSNEPIRGGPAP